jgi:hypothetical protein
VKNEKNVGDFDDLIGGFGNSKPSRQRCGYCAYLLNYACLFVLYSTCMMECIFVQRIV